MEMPNIEKGSPYFYAIQNIKHCLDINLKAKHIIKGDYLNMIDDLKIINQTVQDLALYALAQDEKRKAGG